MPLNGLTAAFVTLLKEDVDNPSFTVKESLDKQTIILTTALENGEALLERLREVFRSHGHTAEHIPFQLCPLPAQQAGSSAAADVSAPSRAEPFPKIGFDLVDIQHLTGQEIFERLFSEEVRKNSGIIMNWQETQGQNNQPLYYYICQNDLEAGLRKSQLKYFKRILSHATLPELYMALARENFKPLRIPSEDVEGKGPLSAHLKSLFSIRKEAEGKHVVRFDCISLVKCIIAPQFDTVASQPQPVAAAASSMSVATNPNTVEIHVSHSHFMAYMSTLLTQGVLLQEHNNRLHPIAMHGRHAIQQSTLINFGIDCSGLMQNIFPRLKTLLVDLLRALPAKLDSHATIVRITRFGSRDADFPVIEFPLRQLQSLIDAVNSFENDGQQATALYQFLVEQYAFFQGRENVNSVFVLLSDGAEEGAERGSDPSCIPNLNVPEEQQNDRLSQTLRALEMQ